MTYVVKRAADRFYTHVGPRFSCAYCDEPADVTDHATPAAWLYHHIHLTETHRFYRVSACHDCNCKASKWFDLTFTNRRKRIARAVKKDNARLLSTPTWSEDELAEMGPALAADIIRAMRQRDRVKRRLKVLQSRSIPHGIPNDMLQPLESAEA